MSVNSEYQYLPSQDQELYQKEDEPVFPSRLVINSLAPLIRISTTVIVLCSIIDIGLILYFVFSISTRTSPVHLPYDIDKLPVVSTYVEFDDLYRNIHPSTKYPPIINRARYFIHVSSELSTRDTVFPVWPTLRGSMDGTIPVLENRLLLTENISTIVQFRVLDYGMENCALILHLPEHSSNFSSITVSNPKGHPPKIEVWKLSTEKRLIPKDVSWDTKPRRINHIGTFEANQGRKIELSTFSCRSGSYQTFELSCTENPTCEIDATTQGISHEPLLYISQTQTI